MNKILYILLDGVGDRPDPRLNYITPLDAAHTPRLDSLARKGISGLVYPVGKNISPESDIAVFHMLGYEFKEGYAGRGVIEAIGAGTHFENGDLALRANFATIDKEKAILDRRAGRDLSNEEAKILAEAINKNVKLSYPKTSFEFLSTISHRAILVIKAKGVALSANISNSDPAYLRLQGVGVAKEVGGVLRLAKVRALDDRRETRLSADLVNEFTERSIEILRKHPVNLSREKDGKKPANAILMRDAGNSLPKLQRLDKKYGLNFACLLDMPVERGIARLTGMVEIEAGGINDYGIKAGKVTKLFQKYDCIYVHIKGSDEPGHDGDSIRKKKVIEDIDSRFFKDLIECISLNEVIVAVSADHSTPCQIKSHSADPVPLLISGGNILGNGTCRFTEKEASRGSLGTLKGAQVLPLIVSLARK
ncbi:MAG: 2,3-bisphosphoglycerate-independent phosphoglycerate mutase [Nitrososphaerales archaeon]|nr:2,3-bisphosphoglycerate-independent phosphoglycerate mutase [Nitrososphaerales archaeon]